MEEFISRAFGSVSSACHVWAGLIEALTVDYSLKLTPCLCLFCVVYVVSCRELREKIQPEIMELIKQQRLNRLCEGTCFRKISSRRRQGETNSQSRFLSVLLLPTHLKKHHLSSDVTGDLCGSSFCVNVNTSDPVSPSRRTHCDTTGSFNPHTRLHPSPAAADFTAREESEKYTSSQKAREGTLALTCQDKFKRELRRRNERVQQPRLHQPRTVESGGFGGNDEAVHRKQNKVCLFLPARRTSTFRRYF